MSFDELIRNLTELGIKKGDIIYVASDMTRVLVEAGKTQQMKNPAERDGFLHGLVNCFQEAVGEEGTLLFPVFGWSFCRGAGFDRRETPGEVGALNNWVLKWRKDFRRTEHPLYSFMVWGKFAGELLEMKNTDAWGNDSPFAWLHRKKAKMLLLSVSLQRGLTFLHYVEESVRVPYRYFKNFRGAYTDYDEVTTDRNYTMYVRDLDIRSQEYLPDEFLENRGTMRGVFWGKVPLKIVELAEAYEVIADDLLNHGGANCYKFENYAIDWSKGPTHQDDLNN